MFAEGLYVAVPVAGTEIPFGAQNDPMKWAFLTVL